MIFVYLFVIRGKFNGLIKLFIVYLYFVSYLFFIYLCLYFKGRILLGRIVRFVEILNLNVVFLLFYLVFKGCLI